MFSPRTVRVEITVPSLDSVTSWCLLKLVTYILSPSGLTAQDLTVVWKTVIMRCCIYVEMKGVI
ncbi:hypothetical protein DPMN_063197 [Dreissena polymorpha]|uniref:Uncharacterized protein n=1 Tax=Dreissena polymorpha TaxID=45954 RepID=A0A9D4CAZ6_DREPO|nr:hypothetical protein DPMN_063197 [Dreissena polymorpha]